MLGDRSARHKESRYRERRVLTYMINQESKQRSEEDVMSVSVWAYRRGDICYVLDVCVCVCVIYLYMLYV